MSRERISDASVVVPVSRSKLWAEIFRHPPTEQAVKCVKVDRTQKMWTESFTFLFWFGSTLWCLGGSRHLVGSFD